MQPLPPEQNTQLQFVDRTTGTNVPKQFVSAVKKVGNVLVRFGVRIRQLIIYCFGRIVDLVVLLVYYSGCVDGSGSLSGGAFNQLRLAMLNIVLTILY